MKGRTVLLFVFCAAVWYALGALAGALVLGCSPAVQPAERAKVVTYEAAALACAQLALRVAGDAGQSARYAAYDLCEHEAWRLYGGPALEAGAP